MADDGGSGKIELKRTLGVFSGCSMVLGTIIGSGIFVSPKGVLMEVGSVGLALVVWTLAGVLSLLGSLCYAEIGTLIPKSGGPYSYIKEAFGDLPGFLYMWAITVIVLPAGNAIISMTFGYYVLQPLFPDCASPQSAVLLFAAVAIATLSFIGCVSVTAAARVQTIFTVIKTIALIVIIFTGIVLLCMGKTDNFQNAFAASTTDPGKIAIAFYSGIFSYAGWDSLNFLTEELKNPYVNLPRALLISIPLTTVIYVFANVAYFTVLTPPEILESEAVAVSLAMRVYGVMSWVMPVFVACSTFGSLNGCLMCVGRVCYVGSREGHLPTFLSFINVKAYTPLPAVIFQGCMAIVMLLAGDVYTLINYCTFVESLSFFVCVCTLLYFRWERPNAHRPIKIPLAIPIIFLIVCMFILVLSLYSSPRDTGMGLLILISGIPVYWLGVSWSKKPKVFQDKMDALNRFIQKLTLGLQGS